MSETIVLDTFAPFVGQPFLIVDANGTEFPVTLMEATAHRVFEFPGRIRDPFQLQFKSIDHSLQGFLAQQTYTVRHGALGKMEIFLVPIGPPKDGSGGFLYQAVFT